MSWSGRRILVTGAGGFIGSHLCERLVDAGAEVTALVRYNSRGSWGNLDLLPEKSKGLLKVISGNVEDPDSISYAVEGQEIVFHLAALIGIPYSYQAARSYVRTNVEGTLNLLESVRKNPNCRVIHTSTSEVYGTAQYVPIDEKHPLQAQSPYAATKIAADKLAESYHRSFGLPVTIVRPFNAYGPRQSARAIIPAITIQALENGPIHLGSLEPIRDLTYVKDTVEGFLHVAATDGCIGEVVNLGTGIGVSIADLAQAILAMMNVKKEIVSDPRRIRPDKSEVQRLVCNPRKALEVCTWSAKHSLTQGLRETIDWILANRQLFRPASYSL